jgi:hypothetical protein
MENKKVTFDFDSTASRKDVQEYIKELLSKDIDVWIVTSRYDDLHKHKYQFNANNDDLWKVVDEVGIPRWKVRFTNMEDKVQYLYNTNVIWHLDDDFYELTCIRNAKIPTIGIQVNSGSWKQKCNRLLNKK